MVGNGRDLGLGDELGQRQPQGDIYRQRQGVLHDQQIEGVVEGELVEMFLEEVAQTLNRACGLGGTGVVIEQVPAELQDLGMFEVRLRHDVGALLRAVGLAGEVETLVAHGGQQ